MGYMKNALFEFLDEAEENEDTVIAWIKHDEVVVIIPSSDFNINPFLSRFIQADTETLSGYPELWEKATACLIELKEEDSVSDEEEYETDCEYDQISLFDDSGQII